VSFIISMICRPKLTDAGDSRIRLLEDGVWKSCTYVWCFWCLRGREGDDGYKDNGHYPWCKDYIPREVKAAKAQSRAAEKAERERSNKAGEPAVEKAKTGRNGH